MSNRHSFQIIRILFGYPDNLYNCSGRTSSEWSATGIKWPILGHYLVFSGTALIFLYFLCLYAMWTLNLLKTSCYHIMFVLGFVDIVNIVNNSIFAGIIAINGYVFCTNDTLMYTYGALLLTCWAAASLIYVLLAVNRVFAVFGWQILQRFFKTGGGVFWLLPVAVYAFVCGVIYKPFPFSSRKFAATVIPFIEDFQKECLLYENPTHPFNNMMVTVGLIICYSTIMAVLCFHRKHLTALFEVKMALQAFLISVPACVACVIYIYLQNHEVDEKVLVVAHIAWQIATGVAAPIYLTINVEIRTFYLKALPGKRMLESTFSKIPIFGSRGAAVATIKTYA